MANIGARLSVEQMLVVFVSLLLYCCDYPYYDYMFS